MLISEKLINDTPLFVNTNNKYHNTIKMAPRFTVIEAVNFKNVFQSVCESGLCPKTITLDFSQTLFIDSSGIGALIHSLKVSQQYQIKLGLKQVNSQIYSLLEMNELTKILQIEKQFCNSYQQNENEVQICTHPSVKSKCKRIIDIIGAITGLLITALLFIPIAIAIKLDSPGPLFFSQQRNGWMGKPFKLWKFRSMVADAEQQKHRVKNEASGAIFKNANDFRVTRIGAFLRRTSLDEFPQFWNVLKGDMSLVGTRPPTLDEVEKYDIPQWRRLDVKPGITGEWQVSGRSEIKDFNQVIRLDLKYQNQWSLLRDFMLILKTVRVIFSKRSGAM